MIAYFYNLNFMKNNKFIFSLLFIFFSLANLQAQLVGNYTIGGTGAKNFQSWHEFADSLYNYGLAGKVNVSVKSNFNIKNKVELKQPLKNSTNKSRSITINGNGYNITGSLVSELLHLNGTDHINLKKLQVINTSTNANSAGIRFSNRADSNTIDSCLIKLGSLQAGTSDTGAYITFSSSNSSYMTNNSKSNGVYNTIQNCIFSTNGGSGPRYAIIDQQSSSNFRNTPTHNSFIKNEIQNFYSTAFYMRYVNSEKIIGNKISRVNAGSNDYIDSNAVVFHVQDSRNNVTSTQISQNTIQDIPYAGSSITASTSPAFNFKILELNNTSGNDSVYFEFLSNEVKELKLSGAFVGCNSEKNSFLNLSKNHFHDIESYTGTSYGYNLQSNQGLLINDNIFKTSKYSINSTNYAWIIYLRNNTQAKGKVIEINRNQIDSNKATYLGSISIFGQSDYDIIGNKITHNRITSTDWNSFTGIYTIRCGNLNVISNLIANNISNGMMLTWYSENTSSSLYTYNAYYNTIVFNDSGLSTFDQYVSFFYDQSELNFVGNVIQAKGTASAYMNYILNPGTVKDNNIWSEGKFSNEYWQLGNNSYNKFSNWYADSKSDKSNHNQSPRFRNEKAGDYRSGQVLNQNNTKATTFSTTDVLGIKRSQIMHDRGAIESYFDLGFRIDYTASMDTVCSGYIFDPSVWVVNNFSDTVSTLKIGYFVNGKHFSESFSQSVPAGDSVKLNFSKPIQTNTPGTQTIAVYQAINDDNSQLDTQKITVFVKPAPGGSQLTAVGSSGLNRPRYSRFTTTDKTIRGLQLTYEVSAPRGFNNGDYGSKWTASASAHTVSGRYVNGATVTAPSTSSSLLWGFNSSDTLIDDSTLTWRLKLTDLVNGCDTIINRLVYISPTPKVDFEINQPLCSDDSLKFINTSFINSTNVYLEYKWEFGTNNPLDTSIQKDPIFKYDTSGNFNSTLYITSFPDTFVFVKNQGLNIIKSPSADFSRDNACEGKPVKFDNKTSPINAKMSWNFGGADTVINATNFNRVFTNYGTYYVSLTAEDKGCKNTKITKVSVYEQPVASFDLTSGSCQFEEFRFQNNTTMKASLFGNVWDFDETNGKSTSRSPAYKFQTSGDKRVKLIVNSEFGCSDTITKKIKVNRSPVVEIAAFDTCSKRDGILTDITDYQGESLASRTWKVDGGTMGSSDSLYYSWKGEGTFNIELSISFANGCTSSQKRTITILKEIIPVFTTKSACSGDTVVFENNTSFNPSDSMSFFWDYGNGETFDGKEKNIVYNATQTTVYKVQLRAKPAGGCLSESIEEVTVWEKPKTCDFVSTPSYETAYYGISFEPSVDGTNAGGQSKVSYDWNLEQVGNKFSSGVNAKVTYELPSDGEYTMNMIATTDDNACICRSSKTVRMDRASLIGLTNKEGVNIYPNPLRNNQKLQVDAESPIVYYAWYKLDGKLLKEESRNRESQFTLPWPNDHSKHLIILLSDGKQQWTRPVIREK